MERDLNSLLKKKAAREEGSGEDNIDLEALSALGDTLDAGENVDVEVDLLAPGGEGEPAEAPPMGYDDGKEVLEGSEEEVNE